MAKERIFIVEDERIVAEDLKKMLERLGYEVVGIAANGAEAIKRIETSRPQLVLMDIRIQGPMDGIDVAEHIYTQFDIPVSYLTAYADENTLDRAKATMPWGYILKPFEERALQTTVELALYRYKMERMFKSLNQWHAGVLEDLSEAVVAADNQGRVTFTNKAGEKLLGCSSSNIFGKSLDQVFKFQPDNATSVAFLEQPDRGRIFHCIRTPLKDEEGHSTGSVLVLKEQQLS